ncbi:MULTISPECIES: hypothetical protein [unclassified Mycoplasma]|uniref:hypothetical protein n=1 Tax=unclassified Mycoplasma TaxID=2683645 RepID=UPI00211C02D2|nr:MULTISPECIES: hypothetical protein [unclassified Mycoplasma]UUM19786.1 hypothetical protein NPA11_03395 [Mycoplasma sp. 1578d]UUM24769.1 hypothetical protein NPA12_03685 [Mycoplasma sp. 3686d]
MNKFQTQSAAELNLSFDFEITDFQNRKFEITIHKMLRDLPFNDSFFEWFMEDLIYFFAKNKYQLRWDIETVYFTGIKNLNLSPQDEQKFILLLTNSVSNFDIVVRN